MKQDPDYSYDPEHPGKRLCESHEPDPNAKPSYFGLPKTDSSINEEKRIRETLPDFCGKPKKGFRRFYHYTDPSNVDSILKRGLLTVRDGRPRNPGYKDSEGDGIWLSSVPFEGKETFAVDLPDDFPLSKMNDSQFVSHKSIPPRFLSFYDRPIADVGRPLFASEVKSLAGEYPLVDFEGAIKGRTNADFDLLWPRLRKYWE